MKIAYSLPGCYGDGMRQDVVVDVVAAALEDQEKVVDRVLVGGRVLGDSDPHTGRSEQVWSLSTRFSVFTFLVALRI